MKLEARFEWGQLKAALDEVPANQGRLTTEILDVLARRFLSYLSQYAPQRTGNYLRSWQINNRTKNSITISSPNRMLFLILEFTGAKPHMIRPVRKQALRFQMGGNLFFSKGHMIKGIKPIPHVRPALKALERDIPGIVYDLTGKIMPKLFEKATRRYRGRATDPAFRGNKKQISMARKQGGKKIIKRGSFGRVLRRRTKRVGTKTGDTSYRARVTKF